MKPLEIFPLDRRKFRCRSLAGTGVLTCLILGVAVLLASETVLAQGETPTTENEVPVLDSAHAEASTVVLDLADWMDDFFDDDRYTQELNRTRIKLELSTG